MTAAMEQIVVEAVANADPADDRPVDKAIQHRRRHPARSEIAAGDFVGRPRQQLGIAHAWEPAEGVPAQIFAGEGLHSGVKSRFVIGP